MQKIIQLLIIEDDASDQYLLRESLNQMQLQIEEIIVAEKMQQILSLPSSAAPDLIFLDLNLPDSKGLETFLTVSNRMPDAAIIVMSGVEDTDIALQAIQAGAQEFIVKGEWDEKIFSKAISYSIERKKIQLKLQESEERYRSLVENAPEALVVMDIEKRKFISVSESAIRLFKKTREDLLKIGVIELSPEYQPDGTLSAVSALQQINNAIEGGKPVFGWTHIDSEGIEIPCEVRLVRLPSDHQVLIRGSIIDITERKKREDELRRLQDSYFTLMNSVDGIVWEADPKTFMFSFVSQQAERLLGYPLENWLNQPSFWADHIHEEDRDWAVRYCVKSTVEKRPHEMEYRMMSRDGRIIWLRDIVSVEVINDEPVKVRGIMIDITERKKSEELLKHSYANLRRLTAHQEEVREEERISIAREIHDELGQQLAIIKMDIDWLNREIEDKKENVQKKLKGLLGIIDNTVKTVRKISSELRPMALDDLGLLSALDWHCHEFEERSGIKTKFSSEIEEIKLPDKIATGLFRIFQESLTNISRHAKATLVNVSLKKDKNYLSLSIIDNGKGFVLDCNENKKTLGILGMRERTSIMDGK
ncbi:MAG: PAS domain S-box protein, partial [Chitinophagaceae bacterium]